MHSSRKYNLDGLVVKRKKWRQGPHDDKVPPSTRRRRLEILFCMLQRSHAGAAQRRGGRQILAQPVLML
eukprot:1981895-Pyramimonas_sp.AAC.1